MKTTLKIFLLSIIGLSLMACEPHHSTPIIKDDKEVAVEVKDGSGNTVTVQIVHLHGHQFAVAIGAGGKVAICEVTSYNMGRE